ncbi:hypothetical protein [uncultured Imperialibacter sp.]|uniref:hypothetical protein n=1 Tax=uncultured Imperialibacter sp. TaxID=1672639 RepID=UPI0030DC6DAC|tara:strand:+ start:6431 stop:6679 length:249 start_codon:yes stop_codon:yes gene_type:complete
MRENLDQKIRPGELPEPKLELYFITSQGKVKLWYYNLYKRQQMPFPCLADGNFLKVKSSMPAQKKADPEASLSTLYGLEIKN